MIKYSAAILALQISEAKVAFFGDIMFSRGIKSVWAHEENPCDVLNPFDAYFDPKLPKIANFENPAVGSKPKYDGDVTFNAPTRFLPCVKETFDLVSLANNHMLDQGLWGLRKTIEHFDQLNIPHIGAGKNLNEAWQYQVIGEFAVISAAYTCFNSDYFKECKEIARIDNDPIYLERTIQRIRENNPEKIITLYAHWGVEYDTFANLIQKDFAHKAIDMGVEFVVGHHPHVAQEIEFYKGVPIFYSLGNAVFDQDWSTFTEEGLALEVFSEYDRAFGKHFLTNIVVHEVILADETMRFKSGFRRMKLDFSFIGQFYKEGPLSPMREKALNNKLSSELFKEMGLDTLQIENTNLKFDECLVDKGIDHISDCKKLLRTTFVSNIGGDPQPRN